MIFPPCYGSLVGWLMLMHTTFVAPVTCNAGAKKLHSGVDVGTVCQSVA